jgi:hypothetical protein
MYTSWNCAKMFILSAIFLLGLRVCVAQPNQLTNSTSNTTAFAYQIVNGTTGNSDSCILMSSGNFCCNGICSLTSPNATTNLLISVQTDTNVIIFTNGTVFTVLQTMENVLNPNFNLTNIPYCINQAVGTCCLDTCIVTNT